MSCRAAEVSQVSQCTINPKHSLQESHKLYYLTPWELAHLSVDYIQGGLLFTKPQIPTSTIIDHLKETLSRTLSHFPTITGRLVTKRGVNPPSYSVFLDCTETQGAQFIHAVTGLTKSDVLALNNDISETVKSLFTFNGVISHDGHTKPLLAVQVTELVDGIFIACSLNHCIADGASYWHFFNTWAEIVREKNIECISNPPINQHWIIDSQNHIIDLQFSHHTDFIERHTAPTMLRERLFHFSATTIARLKTKANAEANTNKISSFQAFSAFVWRCMTRARNLALDQETCCIIPINDRSRVRPSLSDYYFGNCVADVCGSATAGEILGNNLGWSALILHVAIRSHSEEKIRMLVEEWVKNPLVFRFERLIETPTMLMQNSPRFNMYGNDFGWGKPLGVRSGPANKFDGNVISGPGTKEEGSVDLEMCLSPESMRALLLDAEFMNAQYTSS